MDRADFLVPDEPSRTSSATLAALGPRTLRLRLSGWLLRLARGSEGRPALEVHSGAGLIDVSVVSAVCVSPLRGARRSSGTAAAWSLAWGQLPPGADVVEVSFRGWRRSRSVQAVALADAYWVAEVEGHFRSVTCSAGASRVTMRVAREARWRES
ncbi:hypothetical protein EST92_15080 [Streptomyces sp. TM32]|uniref:hypothetical protein n=1 Tax=Streptomyces sp. TM32 TaxID=1652669 RepID=UPI0010120220|nr:hypothetical protein [Streptomyces sp. TM32]RXS82192.1 hypothetical protein EST92_15080 [Streptomyces sp. TM32]